MTDQWWSPARQPPQSIPFRNKFDAARDPLTARNAIGAVDAKYVADAIAAAGGGGGGAPTTAEYITAAADATLTAERVLTNTATVTWDFSTAGQAKANTVLGAGPFQPLDGDLTTIAGLTGTDTIYYRSGTSAWSAVTFSGLTFSGGVLTATAGASTGAQSHGQCRLTYVSTTQIKLGRLDGSKIKITGTFYDIPVAGVLGAPTGLTANSTYNVFVFSSSGTLTIEFSTTGHAPDTTAGNEGVETKTGDPTRTFVGKVWITAGPVFNDSALVRGVLSWFNRRQRIAQFSYSGSTTAVAFTDAGTTATFLVWGDEDVFVTTTGVNYGNGALSMSTQIVIDTGTGGAGFALASGNETTSAATNYKCSVAGSNYLRPAEGKHTLNHQAAVSSGTGTWTIFGHAIFLG